jgi:predicted nucleotidyltransferase
MEQVRSDLSFKDVCDIVGAVAHKYGVKHVYLFGSRARGDFHNDSDYDFCINLGEIDDLIEFSSFVVALKEALDSEVDVVDESTLNEDFANEVLKDGLLIYES